MSDCAVTIQLGDLKADTKPRLFPWLCELRHPHLHQSFRLDHLGCWSTAAFEQHTEKLPQIRHRGVHAPGRRQTQFEAWRGKRQPVITPHAGLGKISHQLWIGSESALLHTQGRQNGLLQIFGKSRMAQLLQRVSDDGNTGVGIFGAGSGRIYKLGRVHTLNRGF